MSDTGLNPTSATSSEFFWMLMYEWELRKINSERRERRKKEEEDDNYHPNFNNNIYSYFNLILIF
jgi:hypothetical protein